VAKVSLRPWAAITESMADPLPWQKLCHERAVMTEMHFIISWNTKVDHIYICFIFMCSSNLLGQEEYPKTRRTNRVWKGMWVKCLSHPSVRTWRLYNEVMNRSVVHFSISVFVRSAIMLYINASTTPGTLLWCRQESSSGNSSFPSAYYI